MEADRTHCRVDGSCLLGLTGFSFSVSPRKGGKDQYVTMAAISLHTLTIPCSRFLFLMDSDPNQQTKEKTRTDSIKHSHKSRVYVKTVRLAVKKHNGGGVRFLADCINLSVKAQCAVNRGDDIFTSMVWSFMITGDETGGFFLKSVTISFVMNTLMVRKDDQFILRFAVVQERHDHLQTLWCELCKIIVYVRRLQIKNLKFYPLVGFIQCILVLWHLSTNDL